MMARDVDNESLATLVGSIYEAAFEPARWAIALPQLVTALHGLRAFLGFTSTVRGRTLTTASHEFDDCVLRQWQEEFAGFDPWYDRSGNLPTGAVVQGLDIVPWDELRKMEVYAACFQRLGVNNLLCASVANHGRSFDFVTVHRNGQFDSQDVRVMRFLAPHLVRAAQLHDKLSWLSDVQAAHEVLFDKLPYGVVLLDPRGRPLHFNREAVRIFASHNGLGMRGNVIHAAEPNAQRKLSAAIAEACDAAMQRGTDGGALLAVPRAGSLRAYQLLVSPVHAPTRERIFEPIAPRVAVVLVVSDPEAMPEPAAATLQRLFPLTPALARLAAALVAGRTLAEYADQACIRQDTARWHLKELFARTGTKRQAELVRLLLSGVVQLADRNAQKSATE